MFDAIYRNIKLPETYFKKYEKLPAFPGSKTEGGWNVSRGWDGHDFPRTWCLLDFIEWTQNIRGDHIAFTCEDDPELEFILDRFLTHTHMPFPLYDLHNLPELEKKIDFFVFNQTIEHLYDPDTAIKNIYKNLSDGAYVFTSVPTINIPHMTPVHFGGLTPMGLAVLFLKNGFQICNMGQFGSYKYIQLLFQNHSWPDHKDLMNENGLIVNEEINCSQCWILARKIKND